MPQSILELIFKTSKQGTGGKAAAAELKELKGTVGEVSSGLLGFNASSLTAVGAVVAVGSAVNKAVTEYQDYAEAMRGMAAITGTGVEETSRLVQAFDDMGISQEKVQSTMESAARKGFVMSIENVSKLADEYKKLSTQEEKNALLTEKLGKGGLAMAKAFEQGGQAIQDAADAQADGMIVTEANIKAAEELRVAQDNLGDAWTAMANSVAKVVVPVLTDVINSSMHATLTSQNMATELEKIPPQLRAGAIAAMEYREAQAEANAAGLELVNLIDPMTEGIAGYNGELENTPPALDAVKQAQDNLNVAMKDYNTQLQYQIASEGLSAEQKFALANAMGLIDEKSRYAIVKTQEWKTELDKGMLTIEQYNRLVAQLANDLQRIESKAVTVSVDIIESGGTVRGNRKYGGDVDLNQANAGTFTVPPGYPNDSFKVGFTSGEEVSTVNERMRSTGEVASAAGPSLSIGTVNISNGMDMAAFEARLTAVMRLRG